ncbi:MAG: hypothetical protein JO048_13240, partial [Methylobacteriaceae bacterium]|nr:hypothetical protein [Methylobacteriaceae bacterium]
MAVRSERSGYDPEMVDTLEADVVAAIETVSRAAAQATVETAAASAELGTIRGVLGELGRAGPGAAAETLAL